MELKMQPFKVFGQHNVASQNDRELRTTLSLAIKSKNLQVQEDEPGLIRFSNQSFLATMIRYDYFQGVKSGEIWITSNPEGKTVIRFNLEVSPIGWTTAFIILGLMLAWPFAPPLETQSLLVDEITNIFVGFLWFVIWREYVRYNVKLFLSRTIKSSR